MSRWDVADAVVKSTLSPYPTLIMHTLIKRADTESAVIPDEFTPSLSDLQRETRMSRASVTRALDELESLGWVARRRPSKAAQMREHARTRYVLGVGASPTPNLGSHRDQPSRAESGRNGAVRNAVERPGVVSQGDQTPSQGETSSSPTVRPGWSHGEPQISPALPHHSEDSSGAAAVGERADAGVREPMRGQRLPPDPSIARCWTCEATPGTPCRGRAHGEFHDVRVIEAERLDQAHENAGPGRRRTPQRAS